MSPMSKDTGTLNFVSETHASRCLEAAPRAGVNGGRWELSGCMEKLHSGPLLRPQPGECCPKSRGKAGREPGRRGAKWGQELLKGKQSPSSAITSSSCSTASLEKGGQDRPQVPPCVGPPKHLLQPQAWTYLVMYFKFQVENSPQNNPRPLCCSAEVPSTPHSPRHLSIAKG